MQQFSETIREQVWEKLRNVYNEYTGGRGEITAHEIERIVIEVLHEDSQREVDYVVKNLFRLDVDNSGSIDFPEFANFLLRRHCGEIALQRMHKNNKIEKGAQHKINADEFNQLLNLAYDFLQVHVDQISTDTIFKEADKDKDGYLTYVEYFAYVEQYLCLPKSNLTPRKSEDLKSSSTLSASAHRGEIRSRFRNFIWNSLREMYDFYDKHRLNCLTTDQIQVLISEVLEMSTPSELEYILLKVFGLKPNGNNSVSFETFAPFFVKNVAELGLLRLQENSMGIHKMLSRNQFISLVRNSFSFLSISKVKDQLLEKFFDKIDIEGDSLISYHEYMDWVTKYLCPLICYSKEYLVPEDDQNQFDKTPMISEFRPNEKFYDKRHSIRVFSQATPASELLFSSRAKQTDLKKSGLFKPGKVVRKMNFSSQSLALRVREQTLRLINKYDLDKNLLLDEDEIIRILECLFQENKNEVRYVINNVFRYDRNGDGQVTHDQLADFFLQMHCGQMALQRLHKNNTYKRGAERMMDENEFIQTMNYALRFIEMTALPEDLTQLFREVDTDKDGYISYREYFQFMRYYFGSLSYAATVVVSSTVDSSTESEICLPAARPAPRPNKYTVVPEERFSRLIRSQSRVVFLSFDNNQNLVFEKEEIVDILRSAIKIREDEIEYVVSAVFGSFQAAAKGLSYDRLVGSLLESYFGEIMLLKFHNERQIRKSCQQLMSKAQFLKIIDTASQIVKVRPDPDVVDFIFDNLDTTKTGYITYRVYYNFIRRYLGMKKELSALEAELPGRLQLRLISQVATETLIGDEASGSSDLQAKFIDQIWAQLKRLYDKYDYANNRYLEFKQVESLTKQVLRQGSKRELEYVLWNIYRFDPDKKSRITFQEFAPFIWKYASEIALQRFHAVQAKGKDQLNKEEFEHVLAKAFCCVPDIKKYSRHMGEAFQRLDSNRDKYISYKEFERWVKVSICRKSK